MLRRLAILPLLLPWLLHAGDAPPSLKGAESLT